MQHFHSKPILVGLLVFTFVCFNQFVYAQNWVQGGNGIITSELLGTQTGTGANLRIITDGTERVRVTTGGNVGIGNTFTPAHLLDVDGDIHINAPASGYMIDQEYVLWHNGDISNIYVGVDAGTNDGGTENTFVGNMAGETNTPLERAYSL